jgi:hypothetical protein
MVTLVDAWTTSHRTTAFLIENLPAEIWTAAIPGMPRRTFRAIAAHLHNARCAWVRTLGRPHGIVQPPIVDRHKVQRRQLLAALDRSSRAVERLSEDATELDRTTLRVACVILRGP